MSREAEHAKPLPCPLHPDGPAPLVVRLANSDDWQTWCPGRYCWSGPIRPSEAEAVARWNEVVGAVARLASFAPNDERALVMVSRPFVNEMLSRTYDGAALLTYRLRDSAVPGLEYLEVTRTESPLPRIAELEAQVAVLREALRSHLIHADEMSYHGEMMVCDGCGTPWNNGSRHSDEATPETHKPFCILSTDAGQRAAAVLKAARAWRHSICDCEERCGHYNDACAEWPAETSLVAALDALDGRA